MTLMGFMSYLRLHLDLYHIAPWFYASTPHHEIDGYPPHYATKSRAATTPYHQGIKGRPNTLPRDQGPHQHPTP